MELKSPNAYFPVTVLRTDLFSNGPGQGGSPGVGGKVEVCWKFMFDEVLIFRTILVNGFYGDSLCRFDDT